MEFKPNYINNNVNVKGDNIPNITATATVETEKYDEKYNHKICETSRGIKLLSFRGSRNKKNNT